MQHAALDPTRQEGNATPRVREQDLQSRKAFKGAAEIEPRERDGGFEWKTEGKGEHVSGGMLQGTKNRGRETVVRMRGEWKGPEEVDFPRMRCADGFHFVIDPSRRGSGSGGREEVEPGVRDGDDGGGNGVSFHEGEFAVDGGVGGVNGAAAAGGRKGLVIVGGEDDEPRRGGRRRVMDVGE
ncbi:MAG: hypothetical protein Q9187_009027, partial [Circinaria calcarea]